MPQEKLAHKLGSLRGWLSEKREAAARLLTEVLSAWKVTLSVHLQGSGHLQALTHVSGTGP